MGDVVVLVLILAVFAAFVALVGLCDRIVGRPEPDVADRGPVPAEVDRVVR